MFAELARALAKPRITRKYEIASKDAVALVDVRRQSAQIVAVHGTVQLCRDPRDDMVIETALRGNADVLVSRDDDLKGDPQLVSTLARLGIGAWTVRRFLAALDESKT